MSADGCVIWPDGLTIYTPLKNWSAYFALDATVNKDPASAAYLSREIQKSLWALRRPAAYCPKASQGKVYPLLLPAYYAVKNFGLPDELPSWQEVQATNGGTSWFRDIDSTVHRNPFKVFS